MMPIAVVRCSSVLRRAALLWSVLAASMTLQAQVTATLNANVLNVGTPGGTALTNPYAVAVDGAGNVYITGNNRILEVPPGGPGTVLNVGTPGVPPTPLRNPFAVAVDGAGNVYISDSNQERILKVPPGGPATVFRSSPIVQYGVAVDGAGNVYIADRTNNQIVEVPPGGGLGTVLNVGSPGGTPLSLPYGLAVDAAGNLYIADTGNNRIVKVPPGGPGTVLNVGSPGGTPLGPINAGLAVDGAGNLYFADTSNNRIVELVQSAQNLGSAPVGTTGGAVTIGYTISGYSGSSYTPTFKMAFGVDTTVSAPTCTGGASPQTCTVQVMLKPTVPGAIKDAVQVLDPTGTTLLTQTLVYGTGTGPLGVFQPGNASVLNVGTPGGTALTNPYAVAVDGAGNVYITGNNRIVKVPPGGPGTVLTGTPGDTSLLPSGIAVDGAGNVYVGDFNNLRIVKVSPTGMSSVLNVGTPGVPPTALLNPFAVAVDGAGDVYISDSNQGRILKVQPGGPATVFRSSPIVQYGVAVDGVGNVYIADRTNNQIVEVPPGGGSGTVLNVGSPGGTPLSLPYGLAVDAAGNLYIADTGNTRIVKVPPGGPGIVLDVGSPGGTPLGPINAGLAVDGAGNLYFADTSNNRIVELAQSAQPLSFATTNVGSTSTDSPRTVTLLNIGNQPLGITALNTTTAGQTTTSFNLSGSTTTCTNSTSLAPGATCALGVQFAPVNVGALTGTVNITDNNLNVEGVQQIPVSGAGVGVAATTLTASVNPQVQGHPVVFTAQIVPTPTTPAPTGTVTFSENGTVLGTGTVSNEEATFTTSSLSVGTHTITAAYSGDSNFAASTSSPYAQVIVSSVPETIDLVGGNDQTAIYGNAFAQPLAVVVTLSGGIPAAGVTVTFAGTGLSFSSGGVVTTNSSGMASVTATGTHVGGFVVTAMANGSTQTVNFALTVTPATLTVTANNASRTFGAANPAFTGTITGTVLGDTFTFSATTIATSTSPAGTYPIVPSATGAALANYTVHAVNGTLTVTKATLTVTASNFTRLVGQPNPSFTYTITGFVAGDTQAVVSGAPAISTTATTASPGGTYPITVTQGTLAAANYAFTFVNGTLTVTKAAGSVSLAVSPNPAVSGSQVTLTATVPAGQTGTVTFYDGTTALGTATISGTTATLVVSTLTQASHSITAVYNGDGNHSTATSTPVTLVLTVPPDFTLTSITVSQLIPPGASANFIIHVPSVNSPFTNVVTLTASGLPAGASYTFNPATLTPGANGADSTLTISVPKQSAMLERGDRTPLLLAVLLVPFALLRRARGRPPRLLLWLLVGLASFGVIVGCGGGGYFNQSQQTYTITVTGTSGSLVRSTTVTLTVQ